MSNAIRQIGINVQTLHNAIKPLLFYCKLFGLVAFQRTKTGYKKSKFNLIVNIVAIITFTPLTIYGMVLRLNYGKPSSMILTTDMMLAGGCLIQTVIAWSTSGFLQNKYIGLLNKIVEIDRKFKQLGVWIFYDNTRKIILRKIIIHTLFTVIVLTLYVKIFDYLLTIDLLIFNISSFISSIINILIVQQVSAYVLILKHRYQILNGHLQDLQHKNNTGEIANIKLTPPVPYKLKMLRIICPIHHEITKAGKLINEAFGLQLLITFGVIFVSITVGLYYVCIYIQKDMDWKWESVLGAFIIALRYIVDTLILCYACHTTIEEVHISGRLLHQIEYTDDDVKDQIEMFSLQIVNENLNFSAVGFFPVDYTLIFSVIN